MNINSEKNVYLLKNCEILGQYSEFTRLMKEQHLRYSNGKETHEEMKQREDENLQKMKCVIDYCIENNILKEYFTRKGREVYAMLKMEYSREYELECTRKFMQKLQDRADKAEVIAKEEAEAREKAEKEKAKVEAELADKENIMYQQALNFEITLINSGKDIEEIRPIAGCTEPYIEMIYTLVKDDSTITAEQLYDKIIKDKKKKGPDEDINKHSPEDDKKDNEDKEDKENKDK